MDVKSMWWAGNLDSGVKTSSKYRQQIIVDVIITTLTAFIVDSQFVERIFYA